MAGDWEVDKSGKKMEESGDYIGINQILYIGPGSLVYNILFL